MDTGIVVALDAMGVIYQPGADVDELVIPFVRERGCSMADADIIALYNDASRGLMSSRELWERLEVAGDPDLLDRDVAARYALTEGLHDFLGWCDDARISVACISNDISEWAALRARHFGLAGAVPLWTISGDVGHRKPDGRIYDAFLRTMPPSVTCVFVDDRVENVAAAVSKGMHGVLFGPNSDCAPSGIASAAGFSSLTDLVAEVKAAEGA